MEENNLFCLVDRDNQHVTLDLLGLGEISQKLEIDLVKKVYKGPGYGWRKIGEESAGPGQLRFIFDKTNFFHLKKALEIAQDFQR